MAREQSKQALVAALVTALACSASAVPARAETLHRVIDKLSFGAQPIEAHVGDVIEWSNQDFVAHTVTAKDGSFDVSLFPGKLGRTTVTHAGKIPIYCRFHPNMTAEIDASN